MQTPNNMPPFVLLDYNVRPEFKAHRDITRDAIFRICKALGENVELEARSSGGIKFKDDVTGYKCIRFDSMGFGNVQNTDPTHWQGDDTVVCPVDTEIIVVCKTFIHNGNAPRGDLAPWTPESIEQVYDVFNAHGLGVTCKATAEDFDKVPEATFIFG